MNTIYGYLVQVAKGNGLYMLALDTRATDRGMLLLPITSESYHQLFPAGEPALNTKYEVTFEQLDNTIRVTSMFNLSDEVVPAELVPTLTRTQDLDQMGRTFMDVKKHEAALQERLAAIRKDDKLMAELQAALDAEQAKREANIRARQAGKGIELLFTPEEISSFNQPDPVPVKGFDLSGMAEESTSASFNLGSQGDD